MHFFKLVILSVMVIACSDHALANLNWKNLTLKNFKDEHNWAIIKAHVKSELELENLLKRGIVRDISVEDTVFTLYNRNGPEKGVRIYDKDVASLIEAKFDSTKKVFFATHGFLSGGDVDWMIELKTAHLNAYDCNFVTIDWSSCAGNILYPAAKDCTVTVGSYLAQIITFLGKQGADIQGMHLIGHSLGAHLMSQVSQHGLKVSRITGLDPAGPLFSDDDLDERIDPSDADFIDIIHTNMNTFGYDGLLGHVDFFPNGGNNQPGCIALDVLCSHSKSHQYYTESIIDNYKFPSEKCATFDDATDNNCLGGESSYMGPLSVTGSYGIYYTYVDDASKAEKANILLKFLHKYLAIVFEKLFKLH